MPNPLTEHFTLEEFIHSDTADLHHLDNQPPLELIPNIVLAAQMMERIRSALGDVSIVINSAYRSVQVNARVGGVTSSDHVQGHAVDMVAPDYGSPYRIAQCLSPQVDALEIGQLIFECSGRSRWIHVSTRTPAYKANRVLTIANGRVQSGIQMI
jgi:hypothetical protein